MAGGHPKRRDERIGWSSVPCLLASPSVNGAASGDLAEMAVGPRPIPGSCAASPYRRPDQAAGRHRRLPRQAGRAAADSATQPPDRPHGDRGLVHGSGSSSLLAASVACGSSPPLTDLPRAAAIVGNHRSVQSLSCAKRFCTLSDLHSARPDSSRGHSSGSMRASSAIRASVFPIHPRELRFHLIGRCLPCFNCSARPVALARVSDACPHQA